MENCARKIVIGGKSVSKQQSNIVCTEKILRTITNAFAVNNHFDLSCRGEERSVLLPRDKEPDPRPNRCCTKRLHGLAHEGCERHMETRK